MRKMKVIPRLTFIAFVALASAEVKRSSRIYRMGTVAWLS